MAVRMNQDYLEKYQEDKRYYFAEDFEKDNCRINIASYYLVESPDYYADRVSEILFGERFRVIKTQQEWSHIQMEDDGYCGWLPSAIIRRVFSKKEKLNKVINRLTNVYGRANKKSNIIQRLSYGSMVFVDSQFGNGGFVYSAELDGWIYRHHLDCDVTQKNTIASTYESFAQRLDGAINVMATSPYVLGGRAVHGFDCSGFVQAAYRAAGIFLPRDSDMQQDYCYYHDFSDVDINTLAYGDLLFWPGHVAIAISQDYLVHATANSMSVVYEPINTVIQRNRVKGIELSAIYRWPFMPSN